MAEPRYPLDRYLHFLASAWDPEDLLTVSDFLHTVAEVASLVHPPECVLCGDTDDYYIVTNEIWQRHGLRHHLLCIPCLESRMGRELNSEDFPDCGVNRGELGRLSQRHCDRMARPVA